MLAVRWIPSLVSVASEMMSPAWLRAKFIYQFEADKYFRSRTARDSRTWISSVVVGLKGSRSWFYKQHALHSFTRIIQGFLLFAFKGESFLLKELHGRAYTGETRARNLVVLSSPLLTFFAIIRTCLRGLFFPVS